jgi:hypothetical protein
LYVVNQTHVTRICLCKCAFWLQYYAYLIQAQLDGVLNALPLVEAANRWLYKQVLIGEICKWQGCIFLQQPHKPLGDRAISLGS